MELDEKARPRKVDKEATQLLHQHLQQDMAVSAREGNMLPVSFMQNLATQFCEL